MAVQASLLDTGVWQIQAGGRLDAAAVPELEGVFRDVLARDARRVIVDLSAANYISSSGLKAIVSTWRNLRARDGALVLAGLGPRLREIFEMVGFTQILDIYDTVDEAQSALSGARQ